MKNNIEKLYEFEFVNPEITHKKAWGFDVYDALAHLGFNDPARTMAAIIYKYTIRAEVTL